MNNRERFKAANFVTLGSEANKETIVDDIVKGLENTEKDKSTPEKKETSKPAVQEIKVPTTNTPKKFGRPRKFKKGEDTKVCGIKMLKSEADFLEEYGGKYGGKTGYVTHLVRQEMERLGVKVENR